MTPRAGWPLVGPGVWLRAEGEAPAAVRPALFLDRDGVVIEDRGFVSDPASVVLVPGAAALIAAANRAGVPVAVVTNQSGIDRGLYGWAAFAAVQDEIDRRLASAGARIDGAAACPFHPDHTPGYGPAHARWRKPGPGMIDALASRMRLDPERSWLVGDRARDIAAAHAAGLRDGVLLSPSGGAEAAAARALAGPEFRIHLVPDMAAAAGILRPLTGASGANPARRDGEGRG